TRPVIALLLVGTVVILAAASLPLDADDQSRNILIGGVVSLGSGAVAFYFASSNAKEARRDLLRATAGVTIPEPGDKTLQQAQALMSRTGLILDVINDAAAAEGIVVEQHPAAGMTAAPGSVVKARFADDKGSRRKGPDGNNGPGGSGGSGPDNDKG